LIHISNSIVFAKKIQVRKEKLTDKVCVLEEVQEDRGLLFDEIDESITSKKELYDIHQDEIVKWAQRVKDK
jgi:hypothetical protein